MRRHEVSAELTNAKQVAIEQLLVGEHTPAVRTHPRYNVVGVGIGREIKRGRALRTPSVRSYVDRKVPRGALPPDRLLPERVGGVPTDVIETGRFRAFMPAAPAGQNRLRPARPGCSIGFRFPDERAGDLMAGTLGALVEADGIRFILSNNHVLANENALPVGSPIFQPALLDQGNTGKIFWLCELIHTAGRGLLVSLSWMDWIPSRNKVQSAVQSSGQFTATRPQQLRSRGRNRCERCHGGRRR